MFTTPAIDVPVSPFRRELACHAEEAGGEAAGALETVGLVRRLRQVLGGVGEPYPLQVVIGVAD